MVARTRRHAGQHQLYSLDDQPARRGGGRRRKNGEVDVTSGEEFPILRRLGLYAAPVTADGNCLFRSLSDQYYGDSGSRHGQVRAEVIEFMQANAGHFEHFLDGEGSFRSWDAYIKYMSQDGVYGDNLEIVAFARRYRVNVVIYQADFKYVISCGAASDKPDTDSELPTEVHIAYHSWEHYSSVRNVAGPHSGMPWVKPVPRTELSGGDSGADSAGSDVGIPQWQLDVIKRSIPYALTPSVEAHISKLLVQLHRDTGAVVEALLMMDDGTGELVEQQSVELQPDHADEAARSQGADEQHNSTSGPTKAQASGSDDAVTVGPATAKAVSHRKKLTPRERKERQKREALNRRRAGKGDEPAKENVEPVGADEGIRTMYI